MKKISILVFALLGFFAFNAQAQINVGATIGAQIPMGDFSNDLKTGFGINAVGKYMLNENMALGLNLGYSKFGTDIDGLSCSMMPVTALFEYYFGDGNVKPFLGADLGLYNYNAKVEYTIMGQSQSSSDSKSYLGFAPTVGILCDLNDNFSLLANLKYNYVMSKDDATGESAATWLGINVGAIFRIN